MARYRTVQVGMWADPKIRGLTPTERLLWCYLLTCPHGHVTGLFHLPLAYVACDTGLPARESLASLRGLQRAGLIDYDQESETVFVRRAWKHQGNSSPKVVGPAKAHIASMGWSPLVDRVSEEYPEFVDTLSEGYRRGYARDQDQDQDQDQEQEQSENAGRPATPPLAESHPAWGLAEHWRSEIVRRAPTHRLAQDTHWKAQRAKWARDMEKLLRIDQRTEADVRELLGYVLDGWWFANCQSPAKLRAKWDTIAAQRIRDKAPPLPGVTPIRSRIDTEGLRRDAEMTPEEIRRQLDAIMGD